MSNDITPHLFTRQNSSVWKESLPFSLLILLFTLLSYTSQGQEKVFHCGHYTKPAEEKAGAKHEFYDRFGNTYSREELSAHANHEEKLLGGCTPNFFNVNYIGSWTTAEQATVCQVLDYITSNMNIATGVIPANIEFKKEALASGVGGVGTPYFLADCGISDVPFINHFRGINTGFGTVPLAKVSITNSPGIVFHTGSTPLPSGMLDLYSVVLHEMLHCMGYASLIGLNGNFPATNNGYSRWDTYLTGGSTNSPLLINSPSTADCCGSRVFNSAAFPNFATDLNSVCTTNTQFTMNGVALAPVNRLGSSMTDQGQALNRFSHLDDACSNGINYVMNPGIATGTARRVMTPAEISILCALGYPTTLNCTSCFGLLNDDVVNTPIVLTNGNSINVNSSTLTANDILPTGTILSFVGSDPAISVSLQNGVFTVTSVGGQTGAFHFRYRVSGCNGQWCDEAEVTVNVTATCISCANTSDCNLFCIGDFEGFTDALPGVGSGEIAGGNNYFLQSCIPAFNFGSQGNSPDVEEINGNMTLHLFGCGSGCDYEGIQMPLSTPIEPGCTMTMTFQAAATRGDQNIQPMLRFWALTGMVSGDIGAGAIYNSCPLGAGANSSVICLNGNGPIPINNSITTVSAGALGDVMGQPGTNSVTVAVNSLSTYSFTWTNNTTTPVNALMMAFDNAITAPGIAYRAFIDNIVIESSCVHQLSVEATSVPECLDATGTMTWEICVKGDILTTTDVNMQLDLPLGMSVAAGSSFDAQGFTTLHFTPGSKNCQTVTLNFNLQPFYSCGDTLTIGLNGSGDDICQSTSIKGNSLNIPICCGNPCRPFNFVIDYCKKTTTDKCDVCENGTGDIWIKDATGNAVNSGFTYSWNTGETAPSITGGAGHHSVTVTETSTGCVEVFEIDINCCNNSTPPTGLDCIAPNILTWNPLSGTVYYNVEVIVNDPDCGCSGRTSTQTFFTNSNTLTLTGFFVGKCLSYKVRAKCKAFNQWTPFSQKVCVPQDCGKTSGGKDGIKKSNAISEGQSQIQLSPNPTNGVVSIEGNSITEGNTLTVFNALGQMVFTQEINYEGNMQIDMSPYNKGFYIVMITNSIGERLSTQKLIKE